MDGSPDAWNAMKNGVGKPNQNHPCGSSRTQSRRPSVRPDLEEPDLRALVTTLSAIADHPEAFTPSAISWTARYASEVLQGGSPRMDLGLPPTPCLNQISLYDIAEAWA